MNSETNILSRCKVLARRFSAILAVALLAGSCSEDRFGSEPDDTDGSYISIKLSNVSGIASRADGDPEAGVDKETLIDNVWVYIFRDTDFEDSSLPVFKQSYPVKEYKEKTLRITLNNSLKEDLFPTGITNAKCYVIANLPETTEIPVNPTLGDLKNIVVSADFATSDKQPSFVMAGDATLTLTKNATTQREIVTGEVHLKRIASKISLAITVVDEVKEGDKTWTPMTDNMYTLITNGVNKTKVDPALYIDKIAADDYFNTATNATEPSHRQRMLGKSSSDEDAAYPYVLTQPYYSYPNQWTPDDFNASMTYITLVVPWTDGENNYRRCYYMVPVVKDESRLTSNVSYHVNVKVDILGSFSPEEPTEEIEASYRAVDWGSAPVNVQIDDYRYLVVNQSNFTMDNVADLNVPFYSSHQTEVTDIKVTYYIYNTTKYGNEEAVTITNAQNEKSTSTLDGQTIHIYDAEVDNTVSDVTGARTLVFDHPLYQWTPYGSNNNVIELTGKLVAGSDSTVSSQYPTASLTTLIGQIDHYVRTNNAAYSRYEIDITIAHSDKKNDPNYQKKIHIVQYPGMYITANYNEGDPDKYYAYIGTGTNMNFTSNSHPITDDYLTLDNFGYAFVNARYIEAASYTTTGWFGQTYTRNAFWLMNSLGLVDQISNSSNSGNQNMYTIEISQLSTNDYIISDPRSVNINNNLAGNSALSAAASTADAGDWCNAARYLNDGVVTASSTTRKLRYYHPTLETDATKNMIAPKFRIASSFGEMYAQDREGCRRRCATYQERGYPAGRWRVPTRAEVEFIAKLANDGKIPKLFQVGQTNNSRGIYMTAQGAYQVLMGGSLSTETKNAGVTYVRCVYDEWYWGSDPAVPEGSYEGGLKYTYVLGDRENFNMIRM